METSLLFNREEIMYSRAAGRIAAEHDTSPRVCFCSQMSSGSTGTGTTWANARKEETRPNWTQDVTCSTVNIKKSHVLDR